MLIKKIQKIKLSFITRKKILKIESLTKFIKPQYITLFCAERSMPTENVESEIRKLF